MAERQTQWTQNPSGRKAREGSSPSSGTRSSTTCGQSKTTLLRDVVAALVTMRVEVMASFDGPASAFVASGQRVKLGAGASLPTFEA